MATFFLLKLVHLCCRVFMLKLYTTILRSSNWLQKKFLFFVLLLSLSCSLQAAYFEYTPGLNEAQKHLVALKIKQALVEINAEIVKHPENVAAFYLLHYAEFYHIMVQHNVALLPAFEKVHAKTLNHIQLLPDNSPYKLFLKGSIHLQSALVKGAFNEYLSAAWDFRTAFQEVNQNERTFPNFLPHKKELGALKALIGTFPSQYNWILNVVGLEGDFDKGLQILNAYIENDAKEPLIEKQQAEVIFALIHLNFGPEKKLAWSFYKEHSKDYHQNLMQCYVRAYIAGKCGENDIALQTLKARPIDESYEQIHYLNLLMGSYLLNELDFSAAIWFKKYLAFSITKGSYKEAYQKLSWIAWLQGDTLKFNTYTNLMIKHSKEIGSETTLMKQDLAKGIYPNIELLKARLLFDGGYYTKAQNSLLKIKPDFLPSLFQKIEWEYRSARIYQEEGKLAEAIAHYKDCLQKGKDLHTYLLPNACLQLGGIYEKMNYRPLARTYYEQVSNYSDYDYDTSISQKAKANLLRLK